jgi:hypothetical protein
VEIPLPNSGLDDKDEPMIQNPTITATLIEPSGEIVAVWALPSPMQTLRLAVSPPGGFGYPSNPGNLHPSIVTVNYDLFVAVPIDDGGADRISAIYLRRAEAV